MPPYPTGTELPKKPSSAYCLISDSGMSRSSRMDAVGERACRRRRCRISCLARTGARTPASDVASSLSRSPLFAPARLDHVRADAAQPRVVEARRG